MLPLVLLFKLGPCSTSSESRRDLAWEGKVGWLVGGLVGCAVCLGLVWLVGWLFVFRHIVIHDRWISICLLQAPLLTPVVSGGGGGGGFVGGSGVGVVLCETFHSKKGEAGCYIDPSAGSLWPQMALRPLGILVGGR